MVDGEETHYEKSVNALLDNFSPIYNCYPSGHPSYNAEG